MTRLKEERKLKGLSFLLLYFFMAKNAIAFE